MKYRIRNKSTKPVLTFTDKAWRQITENYSPEAYVMAWNCFRRSYKQTTGKDIDLDYAQKGKFNEWVGANESGVWKSTTSKLQGDDYLIYAYFYNGLDLQNNIELTMKLCEKFLCLLINSKIRKLNYMTTTEYLELGENS